MASRHYVVIIRDEQGDIIDHYDGDPEVHRLRQQVADLRELLDNVRRLALELSKEILESKQ